MLTSSDWVLIGTTLFLGAVALFVPYLAEQVKRSLFAPDLKVSFEQSPPACHLTSWRSRVDPSLSEPVYFFRLEVENRGKTQARLVEALIEELWVYDASGAPRKISNFSAINLRFDEAGSRYISINPHRRVYWNIGHVSSPSYQRREEVRNRITLPGQPMDALCFAIELLEVPFGQPNSLAAGLYALKLSLYAENSPSKEIVLRLAWSGKWQESETDMFREVVLTRLSGHP
jgi:hypothetical protein